MSTPRDPTTRSAPPRTRLRDVRRGAVPHRRRAVRVDDGARVEDLLFPLPVSDDDAPVGARLRRRERDLSRARRPRADHVAVAAAELSVVFGLLVLVTGPLWARKAWGVWWIWDARITSTFVMWMVFVAYLLLRRFGGAGSEVLAAAVGIFGMALVPFVYWSVNFWRTIHPPTTVIPTLPPDMGIPLSSAGPRSRFCSSR